MKFFSSRNLFLLDPFGADGGFCNGSFDLLTSVVEIVGEDDVSLVVCVVVRRRIVVCVCVCASTVCQGIVC